MQLKFAYEDLSPMQFEGLIVAVCQFVLGAGTQGFATGPDGGRDAKFVGTAELYPSKAQPWKGTVIVQAKHTNAYNSTFSDPDFFSDDSQTTVLTSELPRIRKLRSQGALDHYMLFSNRRLTGNAETKLATVISKACELPPMSVSLCGVEQLELWIKRFPDVARIADIDPLDSPLIVSPDDLSEVVEHLAEHVASTIPTSAATPTERVSYEAKNALNKMSKEYAQEMRRRFLKDTTLIKTFLALPGNQDLLERYQSAVDEFQLKVVTVQSHFC